MRVLIDSNVLISAALNANSVSYLAFLKAVSEPNQGLICEQNVDEMRRVFNKKFPHKLSLLNEFLANALLVLDLISVPEEELESEEKVRDKDDRPILRAAIQGKADVLLTGDKDFLESGLVHPMIMTPADFLHAEFNGKLGFVVNNLQKMS